MLKNELYTVIGENTALKEYVDKIYLRERFYKFVISVEIGMAAGVAFFVFVYPKIVGAV